MISCIYFNAVSGYKIPLIENLGATMNQFDTIDFSDNEIRKLDNFPFLPRLKCLLLNNNRVCRVGEDLHESLPALNSVIFTNNNIQELADIETLACCKNMSMLSFLHNPVVAKPNYRLFVIHKFPELRVGTRNTVCLLRLCNKLRGRAPSLKNLFKTFFKSLLESCLSILS